MFINYFDINSMLGKTPVLGQLPNKDEVLKRTVKIAWPSVLESFLVSMVSLVDNIMVSALGTYAIAAVGLSLQPKFLGFALILSLNIAVSALVARRRGEEDREGANKVLRQSLILALVIIAFISVIFTTFARPLLIFCGAQTDTVDPATSYFKIIMSMCGFQLLSMVINAAQRGVGKTKIAMWTNIVSNVVNVILNYLLIGGNLGFPALGVNGAAIATVIGSACAFAISFASLLNPEGYLNIQFMTGGLFDKNIIKSLANLAAGSLMEQVCFRIGFLTFSIIVAKLGTQAYAAHQIGLNCMNISFSIGEGFSVAAVALVGSSLGRKRSDIAKIYGIACKRLGLILGVFLSGVYILFGKRIYMFFTNDQDIVDIGGTITKILALTLFFQISQVITGGCLKGAGDTKFVAFSALVSVAIIRPVATYTLCYPFGFGLAGAWIGTLLDQMMRTLLTAWRFRNGKWANIKI